MTLLPISGFPGVKFPVTRPLAVWKALISSSSKFNTCVGSFVVDAGTCGFVDLDFGQKIFRHRSQTFVTLQFRDIRKTRELTTDASIIRILSHQHIQKKSCSST